MGSRITALDFLKQSMKIETDDCIPWPYAKIETGYGQLSVDGQVVYAHRVVCEMVHGKPPPEKPLALHSPIICHNSSCINKRHLRWGSYDDNSQDKKLDGTVRQGIKHPMAVLTEKQVKEIFLERGTYVSIAKMYPVTEHTIGKIKRGERWWHLTKSLSARELSDLREEMK